MTMWPNHSLQRRRRAIAVVQSARLVAAVAELLSLDGFATARVMEEKIRRAYRDLERRMESEDEVYLPNPEPTARVDYILICMEPSLEQWARSAAEARARVDSGFKEFSGRYRLLQLGL